MGWMAPNNSQCIGMLDLRSDTKCAMQNDLDPGYGLFGYNEPQKGIGDLIIDDIGNDVGTINLDIVAQKLGLGEKIAEKRGIDLIWDLLNHYSDPTGQTSLKPLMPGHNGQMKLFFGDYGLVKCERYDEIKHPQVINLIQANYQKMNDQVIKGELPIVELQKHLSVLSLKTGIEPAKIIPSGLDVIEPLVPQTTRADSFTRTDATVLGTSSEGFLWTQFQGADWEILTNTAGMNNAQGGVNEFARLGAALSSDDMYAQVNLATVAAAANDLNTGILVRKDSTTTQTFYAAEYSNSATPYFRTYKMIAGSFTGIGSNTTGVTAVNGDTLKLDANGSTINRIYNGSSQNSTTDTSVVDNLYGGLSGHRSGSLTTAVNVDNFYLEDPLQLFSFTHPKMGINSLRPFIFTPGLAK